MEMSSLLSKLSAKSNSKAIEPREIFMGLPQKENGYEYPRDVQTDVWKKWFITRNEKNCIIKMNTGSGKTVVGLIILQSCLNEGKGPTVYVVPDKYLVTQVCNEAKRLGIKVTDSRDDFLYSEKKAILVMPIQALVNGKSVFGMRSSGNYQLGSVLIDDVHACLDTISSQYSIRIPASHGLYKKIVSIFADRWKTYNSLSYTNIVEMQDPLKTALIPFWMWQDSTTDVVRILKEASKSDNQDVLFSLPLIEDNISLCNCVITARAIEITPFGISIDKIKNFASAERRVFMSATLADDSVFVSNMGLKEDDLRNIITPESANDLGDRLILFPKHLNSSITDDQIKSKVYETAEKHNVVVIVPSKERARFWDSTGNRIVMRENIEAAVSLLKTNHVGLLVFVNRYDGVDLPGKACCLLVIDGLPPLRSDYDQYIQSIDPASDILLREQVQRIEQGMGRGVRANSDSCCVILMGDKLADVLVRNDGVSFFSAATKAQYSLSKELWTLLREECESPSVEKIWELADYSLNREIEWIQMSKKCLSSVKYDDSAKIDPITLSVRKAYEYACFGQWEKAVEAITHASNSGVSESTAGYLLQIKAAYQNFYDKAAAQQTQLAAHSKNIGLLSPISGIQHTKLISQGMQAKNVCNYAAKIAGNQNDYVIYCEAIAAELNFSENANGFEKALESVGKILGFESSRPDKETNGAGPDNLWAVGDNYYFVVECKSGAVSHTISKEYCNQLGGSVRWFEREYENGSRCIPIIVHPSSTIDTQATAVDDMRIITQECLEKFKKQMNSFIAAFAKRSNWQEESMVNTLLQQYKLRPKDIIQEYTCSYRLPK